MFNMLKVQEQMPSTHITFLHKIIKKMTCLDMEPPQKKMARENKKSFKATNSNIPGSAEGRFSLAQSSTIWPTRFSDEIFFISLIGSNAGCMLIATKFYWHKMKPDKNQIAWNMEKRCWAASILRNQYVKLLKSSYLFIVLYYIFCVSVSLFGSFLGG